MKLRLAEILKERKIQQTWLAEKTGISHGYISLLKSNKRTPSMDIVEKIARALDIPLTDLIVEDAPGPGFAEEGVRRIDIADYDLRRMCRALGVEAQHPVIFELRDDAPSFAMRRGDRMLVDLQYSLAPGDLIVATQVSEDDDPQSAFTGVFRWLDPWLEEGTALGAIRRLSKNGEIGIVGKIAGCIRATA